MSKALDATCLAGVVKVGDLPVAGATVLSEGVAQSQGVLIIEADKKTYVAKTSPDLKSTLDKISSALSQIATALTAIDGKPTGTLAPAPVATTNITQISTLQAELSALKDALK